jgi:VanZ family protein
MPQLSSMFSRMPRRRRVALYAAACSAVLYMTLAPGHDVPGVGLLWDKAEHAIAWAVLTGAGLLLSTRRRWAIGVFAFVFGAVIEVLQATMGWGRDGDWHDLAADSVGIVMAYGGWWIMRRLGWVR